MMWEQDPDRGLWQRAQQGDEGAYDHLRRKYRALVCGEIRKRLTAVSADDLHDIEQDVWIAVWQGLPNFRGVSTFSTWVVGITKNTIFNWLRRKKMEGEAVAHVAPAADCDAEVSESRLVSYLAVYEAMKKLLATEREVISMRYFMQLTDEEISQHLQVPLGTVKSRIRAGLEKLRAALQVAEEEVAS
ncbi:MAG: sigma-70 family RNA polymerase sigma factor [Abditibacteriales bacterium]|nr:sigma-70 family RNA polymerase sigma factor [Abditibacteriales bacterium]